MPVTRYPNGITTAEVSSGPLALFELPTHDVNYWYYVNDFITGGSGITANTGTLTAATYAKCPTGGITNTTASGSAFDTAHAYIASASVCPVAGKKMFFETRLYIDSNSGTASAETWMAGIAKLQTGTSFYSNISTPTYDSGIMIGHQNGTAGIIGVMRSADSQSTVTLSASNYLDQWVRVGFYFDGTNTTFYINGVSAGEITGTTNLPVENIAPFQVFLANGETVAKNVTVDWAFIGGER